jgi:hypothetical protein
VTGLNQLVVNFPPTKRIVIYDTHGQTFPAIDPSDPESKPDISVSWPSKEHPNTQNLDWSCQSTVFIVQPKEADDPAYHKTDAKPPFQNLNIFAEIGLYARNLMFAQMSLFVFVVGIYGHTARIYRFDHAAVVSSRSFDYVKRPEILGEFFWRLVHPVVNPVPAVFPKGFPEFPNDKYTFIVGSDTSVIPVPENNRFQILNILEKLGLGFDDSSAIKFNHYILVRLGDERDLRPCVTIGPVLYRSTRLFSRATAVWKVLPLPLTDSDPFFNIYALKDVWHPCHMPPEVENYRHIFAAHGDKDVRGLARCCGNIDLGEIEGLAGHFTTSAPPRRDGRKWNRYHTRSVIFPAGQPLEQFESTQIMVEALTDAIKGTYHF